MEWRSPGKTAVITGGASGIGLAAAKQFLADGMNVVIADLNEESLAATSDDLSSERLKAEHCDVSKAQDLESLRDKTLSAFGGVHCIMNNAGMGLQPCQPWENPDVWKTVLDTNLWGVIHGCQAFIPAMLEGDEPGAIINTGSKQGITKPPGNYSYNLSKTGVIAYSESVAHALRQVEGCKLSAHLLIPGFVYSGMVSKFIPEQPPSAWTSEQTIEFMIERLESGDFYVLCPDNETPRELDEKRIQWTADDLIKNRPALSRWHPDFETDFAKFVGG